MSVTTLAEAEEALGTARLEELVCEAAGPAAWAYPRSLDALRSGGALELDPMLSGDDVASWQDRACRIAGDGLADALAAAVSDGGWPSAGEVREALVSALDERMSAALEDAEWADGLDVAGRLAGILVGACGFEGDPYDLAIDLRCRFGTYYHPQSEEVCKSTAFPVTLLVRDPSDPDLDSMRSVLASTSDWILDGGAAAWSRPEGAGRCALDMLCESQGTTLDEVMAGAPGAFASSLREELADARAASGTPCVAVLLTLDLEGFSQAVSVALGGPTPASPLLVPADAVVGVYDPYNGAGSALGVHLDSSVDLPTGSLWDVMPDGPDAADRCASGWTVQACYGLVGSAWDTRLDAERPAGDRGVR